MELIYLLLGLQTAAALAGGVFLWRRQSRQTTEIAALREALVQAQAAVAAKPARRAAAGGEVISLRGAPPRAQADPLEPPARSAPKTGASTESIRGLVLGALAFAPALGLAFGASVALVVAIGLVVGAAMLAASLHAAWRAGAWAGVATASVWAIVGLGAGSAETSALSFSIAAALAGVTGLVHAHQMRGAAGAAMAAAMLCATLALGGQIGMIGAAGGAFGFVVAAAAITGAANLRLEGLTLGAFAAALAGLFVLSGQDSAAIWFTPAAAWAGALFFAIAAIRTPQLGPRGALIAGIGVLAPLAAIAALYLAQQGLANRFAAAGAFLVLAGLIGAVIAAAAARRERGLESLKLTLWVLSLGAFAALIAAVALAIPAALAALLFALTALALAAIDLKMPARLRNGFAVLSAAGVAAFAVVSAQQVLTESNAWPAFALIGLGAAAPALALGAAAYAARRRQAPSCEAALELFATLLAIGAASLVLRLLYSGGAFMLTPVSFAELGAHAGICIAAGAALRWRARHGARLLRVGLTYLLWMGALAALTVAALLWLTPFWSARESTAALIGRDTLGFLMPAIALFALWRLWRSRRADLEARISLAAAALLLAAFVTMEVSSADGDANWLGAVAGSLAFALAIAINFIPGVVRRRRQLPQQA